jgi:hypothetical protein
MSNANAAYLYSNGSQRYGQFLMNEFNSKHPQFQVPQEADCFYDNKKVGGFLKYIHSIEN